MSGNPSYEVHTPGRTATSAGGRQPALGGTKPRSWTGVQGATDTAESCCAAPRARDWGAQGPGVLTRHKTHETCLAGGQRQEPSLRTAKGSGERLGQARGGLIRWGGGQVGEERVGLSPAPIPQACGATSWGPERDLHGTCDSAWNVLDPGAQNRSSRNHGWRSHKEGTPGPPGRLRGR